MRSKRGRVLIAVLVVASIVALTVIMVSRGGAVTVQIAPTGSTFTVAAGANLVRGLPLNTPVSISISETGGGSSGTATIVACSDGTAWSWIGLNGITVGGSYVARGVNVATANTAMSTTGAGQWVHTVSAAAGTVRISSTAATPVRAYINY